MIEMNRRNIYLLFVLLFFSCSQNEKPQESKNVVLFVCKHGAARSPIAAAHFEKLISEKGLSYTAVFKGTEPNSSLTAETLIGLSYDSLNVAGWVPEKVSQKDVDGAAKIVTFDLDLDMETPMGVEVLEWNGIPSISEDYEIARNEILARVDLLIESLSDTEK